MGVCVISDAEYVSCFLNWKVYCYPVCCNVNHSSVQKSNDLYLCTLSVWEEQWPIEMDSGLSGQVQALAGVIVSCSWARHFTLTVPLFT